MDREDGRLVMRTKKMVDRDKAEAKERIHQILERVWERNKDVDPKLIEKEIAKALKEIRKQHKTSKTTP